MAAVYLCPPLITGRRARAYMRANLLRAPKQPTPHPRPRPLTRRDEDQASGSPSAGGGGGGGGGGAGGAASGRVCSGRPRVWPSGAAAAVGPAWPARLSRSPTAPTTVPSARPPRRSASPTSPAPPAASRGASRSTPRCCQSTTTSRT